jgi:hypothetical protein
VKGVSFNPRTATKVLSLFERLLVPQPAARKARGHAYE